jgi:hypothetical protein
MQGRLPLSVDLVRDTSRFERQSRISPWGVIFSPSVVCLAVEFPLCQLGHLTKPGEIARAAEFVAHKKNKPKKERKKQ